MNDRIPPHDEAAERAVLGACMLNPRALTQVADTLRPADFYQPRHETIYAALLNLAEAGKPTDPVSLLHTLGPRADGPYLHTLTADTPAAVNAGYWADLITDRARRRRAIEALDRATLELQQSEDPAEDVIDRTAQTVAAIQHVDTDVDSTLTLDEFCDQTLPAEDWVVDGLLARGDRLVVTGVEGLGKSTVMRMLAVCAAAGIHPFTLRPTAPQTVLFVDAENPQRIMVNRFSQLRSAAHRRGLLVEPTRLWIDRRPGGLDLADRRDRRWLTRRCETINPDLLAIGPAYKLYLGGANQREEDLARQVTSVLDGIREQTGCALILEHHSPHATPGIKHRPVRPIGSSLWLRWPEFGYGIRYADHPDAMRRRIVDWVSWRGPRDDRAWPDRLEAGADGWPWVEAEPATDTWRSA